MEQALRHVPAMSAIAAATGLALAERKRRKDAMRRAVALSISKRCRDEESRQLAEAQREAARKNAAFEFAKAQNYLQGKAMLKALLAQSNLTADERKSLLEEAGRKEIGAGLRLLSAAVALREALTRQREQAWQDYPAGERAAAIMPPRQITAFKVFEGVIYSCGSSKRAYNQGIVSIIPNDGPVNE